MIVAGDEFGRTQGGNNNAYCQDSEIGWVNWNLTSDGQTLLDFTRKLGAFRHQYPVLRRNRFYTGRWDEVHQVKDVTWIRSDGHEAEQHDWTDSALPLRRHADGRARPGEFRAAGRRPLDPDDRRQRRPRCHRVHGAGVQGRQELDAADRHRRRSQARPGLRHRRDLPGAGARPRAAAPQHQRGSARAGRRCTPDQDKE